jgi:ribosomal RNA-processing protein 36
MWTHFRFLSMPRRPRPADRPAPNSKPVSSLQSEHTLSSKAPPKQVHSRLAQVEPESIASEQEPDNDSGQFSLSGEEAKSVLSDSEPNFEEDNQDIDVDAPRVAQWEPDEFEIDDSGDEDDSEDDEKSMPRRAGPSSLQLVRLSLLR